jgi:hypothetical protein
VTLKSNERNKGSHDSQRIDVPVLVMFFLNIRISYNRACENVKQSGLYRLKFAMTVDIPIGTFFSND